MSRKTLHS